MIFNISKNSGEFLNVAEYIETDLENFNYLEIDKTSLNPNHFLDTQMLTLTLNPNLYENNIDLDEEILGEFTVKLKNKFIDVIGLGISFSFLFLSHNPMVLTFTPILFVWVLFWLWQTYGFKIKKMVPSIIKLLFDQISRPKLFIFISYLCSL